MDILFKGKPIKRGDRLFQIVSKQYGEKVSEEVVISIGEKRYVISGSPTYGYDYRNKNHTGKTELLEKKLGENFFWTREEAEEEIVRREEDRYREEQIRIKVKLDPALESIKSSLQQNIDVMSIPLHTSKALLELCERLVRVLEQVPAKD